MLILPSLCFAFVMANAGRISVYERPQKLLLLTDLRQANSVCTLFLLALKWQ